MFWSSEGFMCSSLQGSVFKLWPQLLQPLPSFLCSVPCSFLQASLSNPVVDTPGNLFAFNLFCSIRINIPLKALSSEEPSPLQLPSALAKSSLLTLTGHPFLSFPLFGGTAGQLQLFPSMSTLGNEVITSALLEP